MFALGSWHTRQLTTKLIFLDAIGSDPTKPRKIPGRSTARLLLRMASCVGLAIFSLPEPRRKLQLRNFKQDLILFAHAHLAHLSPFSSVLSTFLCGCTEPYSMHTGFNPSKSGYIQQHLEDCGPLHNSCDGGSYMNEDYNQPGWY